MNHFMLPGADTGGGALAAASGRYGAYAMEQLINEMLKRGAAKANLQAKVFGGGALMRNLTTLRVGERNAAFVLEYLRAEGIRVVSQDLLGLYPRRVAFFATSGRALCKRLAETDRGLLAAERQYAARINASELGGAFELF
jgi:chemotaxis protein CheD